jgi:hypothetical protein
MRPLAWLFPLALFACTGSTDDKTTSGDDDDVVATGCLAEPLTLEVGTGVTEFLALGDGDDITMTHGPQGGWHIDVAGRVGGTEQLVEVDAVFVKTQTSVQIAGDQQPGRQALVAWDDVGCTGDFFGTRVFIDDTTVGLTGEEIFEEICTFDDIDVTMTVTVTVLESDPQVTVTQSMALKLQLDPVDRSYCDAL